MGIVHELDVGRRVLVPTGNEPCFRIGDGPAAWQSQGEIVIGKRRDDGRLRGGRDQDRLAGPDRHADGARKLIPELSRGGMCLTPLANYRLDLVVAARVVWN